jgi:hypothetical protein
VQGIERSLDLVDELYLQLLRHLRGSNRSTSVRGWELLLLAACASRWLLHYQQLHKLASAQGEGEGGLSLQEWAKCQLVCLWAYQAEVRTPLLLISVSCSMLMDGVKNMPLGRLRVRTEV